MEHIAKTTRDVMWLTKGTGGIGLSVTKLRAQGSPIRSNNTTSTGPIPFMHTIDSILRAVSRGGKKNGALCFYMENWHLDFPEFLDLRQNSGDPYRRTRTANTAVWISDEFMKRVQNDDDWYMFDPLEVQRPQRALRQRVLRALQRVRRQGGSRRNADVQEDGCARAVQVHPDFPADDEPPVADLEGHDQQPRPQQQHRHDPPVEPVHRDQPSAGREQRLRLQPGVDQPVAAPASREQLGGDERLRRRLRQGRGERTPRDPPARQPDRHHPVIRRGGRLLEPPEPRRRPRRHGLHRHHRAAWASPTRAKRHTT